MSADHTITTKNRTEEIAETTQKLLHDYFERSGSASLINRLAPDVLWFSEEESGGKEEAARYLTAWKEGFFNSYVESESYEAKNLGEGYSLCIANLALLVHPGKTFTLHQTRKLTFIFRRLRDKNTDESTWEIIHLAVQGLKNKEIVEEQKVAEITIKKAMSTIYRKLNISGRPELLTIFGEEKHEEE